MNELSRVLGCLLGTATGDALGVPSSFLSPIAIKETFGWIDTFYDPEKDHIFHAGLKAGEYTDDTEQTLALINSFIRYKRVIPEDIALELEKWAQRVKNKYISPFGPSTEKALKAIKEGKTIGESGKYGNTNGSAMRISPIGIIHGLRKSSIEEIARDVRQTCLITHNTKVAISSATAIAWGIAVCMMGETDIEKVVEEVIKASIEGEKYGYDIPAPSIGSRIELAVNQVLKANTPEQGMSNLYRYFGGGDLCADSIPYTMGIFVLGKGDVKATIEYAINGGGDCDTNAAMAGAMVGAMNGIDAIPLKWRQTVQEINGINFAPIAQSLIELAPKWEVSC
jgi:ADP-ribosylglycohydrolase